MWGAVEAVGAAKVSERVAVAECTLRPRQRARGGYGRVRACAAERARACGRGRARRHVQWCVCRGACAAFGSGACTRAVVCCERAVRARVRWRVRAGACDGIHHDGRAWVRLTLTLTLTLHRRTGPSSGRLVPRVRASCTARPRRCSLRRTAPGRSRPLRRTRRPTAAGRPRGMCRRPPRTCR